MFSFRELLSSLTPFITAAIVIVASPLKELIPSAVQKYVGSIYEKYFYTPQFTFLIEEESYGSNVIYEAAKTYLRSKVADDSSDLKCLKVRKTSGQKGPTVDIVKGQKVMDSFEDINWLKWRLCGESKKSTHYELSFEKKFKEAVLKSYLPHVISRSEDIHEAERALKLCSLEIARGSSSGEWDCIALEHPATFDKLAMDPGLKRILIEDLDRFVKRKEWYKKVGRAWKRGYLIYGPPGTGKSTLIAAIANHLKFDIYDLNISSINSDSDLRKTLLSTNNRSIVAIEDIDCAGLEKRGEEKKASSAKTTLSGLLNVIDGLWSSSGDERIIVFTTNNKDDLLQNLDSALLRPGRMDMHVHMSYCTLDGFKLLASTYLDINEDHELYEEIEQLKPLFEKAEVTPAEIAEELSKTEDKVVALRGVVELLEKKGT